MEPSQPEVPRKVEEGESLSTRLRDMMCKWLKDLCLCLQH